MISHLDEASEFGIRGWAAHEGNPQVTVSLDIFIDHLFVTRVSSGTFRADLAAAGYGNGYHAFSFNPFDYLWSPNHLVEVRECSSGTLIDQGAQSIRVDLAANRKTYLDAKIRSQRRWAESAPLVTIQPDTFQHQLEAAAHFHPALNILELGPGHGLLLETALRQKYFASYLGLDLSRPAIMSLHARFADTRTRFLTGDAARYPLTGPFHLVIASGLFETIFPSFLPVLQNITKVLAPGGLMSFDLAVEDDRNSTSRATWDGDRYLRLYSEAETRRLLVRAGLELFGTTIYTKVSGEHRVFVTASKPQKPPRNSFESA